MVSVGLLERERLPVPCGCSIRVGTVFLHWVTQDPEGFHLNLLGSLNPASETGLLESSQSPVTRLYKP